MGCIGSKHRTRSEPDDSGYYTGEHSIVQVPLPCLDNIQDWYDQHCHALRHAGERLTKFEVSSEKNLVSSTDNISDRANATFRCEGQHLGNILPEDVWHLVFRELGSSNDAENLANASLYFRQIFLSKRPQFLFPKVVPILAEYLRDNYEDSDNSSLCPMHKRMLQLNCTQFKYCTSCGRQQISDWFSDFLKLRLIDRKWSTAIDNVLQITPSRFSFYEDTLLYKRFACVANDDFTSEEDVAENIIYVRNFLDHFEKSHGAASVVPRNPFLGRHLSLTFQNGLTEIEDQDENDQEMQLYVNVVSTALSKYGHHLWYCVLLFDQICPTLIQRYRKLRDVLQLLPNLRALSLEFFESDESTGQFDITDRVLADLATETTRHPLPTISSLKVLTVTDFPNPILLELLRRNTQLTRLEMDSKYLHEERDIYSIPLPNLKELVIFFDSEADFRKLRYMKWAVSKLSLDFAHTDFISWNRIFRVIEANWRETLTDLKMVLPLAVAGSEMTKLRREGLVANLDLPSIKRLTLTMGNYSYLDFILPMKHSLERLDIKLTIIKSGRPDKETIRIMKFRQVIEFVGYFGRMDESNIWSLFPKLKQLNYENRKGRRMEIFRRDVKYFEE